MFAKRSLGAGQPKAGEARIRHTAIGLNFQDIYARSGLYPMPLPSGLGTEAVGVVEAVGSEVRTVKPAGSTRKRGSTNQG